MKHILIILMLLFIAACTMYYIGGQNNTVRIDVNKKTDVKPKFGL